MLARVFRTSSLLAPRSLCSNFNRSYTENDDSFIRQYFFRKSFLKPFTITSESNLLSVSCMKGRFKQHKDYIALDKLGTILMEFIPYTKDSENYRNLDYKLKKNFALSLNHVGQILKYNPYSFVETKIDLEFKYNITSAQAEEKTLTFKKTAKEEKLQIALNSQKQGVNSNVNIRMDMGEFIILQELLRYSIPYMLGWHIMSSPRIAEEEFSSNPPEKGENVY